MERAQHRRSERLGASDSAVFRTSHAASGRRAGWRYIIEADVVRPQCRRARADDPCREGGFVGTNPLCESLVQVAALSTRGADRGGAVFWRHSLAGRLLVRVVELGHRSSYAKSRNCVNCVGAKLLSLTSSSVRRPSRRRGPKVIPSTLSSGRPSTSRLSSSVFSTGSITPNRPARLLRAADVVCVLQIDPEELDLVAGSRSADRERPLHGEELSACRAGGYRRGR